jgi:molybdate transport system ATP-binding protein
MLRATIGAALREFELAVELEAPAGSCVALVGPSGSGKSTVLRSVAGLRRPDRGRVELDGEVWFDDAGAELPSEARNVGYLFQDYALFPHLSAWRNVAFGLTGMPHAERRERATQMLDRFGVARLAEERPRDLSGGERQRVALARALARGPRLLLLDEPLSALDSRTRAEAARELGALISSADVPTVLVTHDFADAALLADEVAVIDRGRIIQRGTPAELSARPASAFVADFAGAAVLFGVARAAADGTTAVALDGGGEVRSTDQAEGPVAVAVFPWEVTLVAARDGGDEGSALNRLRCRVESLREVGNRVRVGLSVPQPLAAEVTSASVERLGLEAGAEVVAIWKATATRLTAR